MSINSIIRKNGGKKAFVLHVFHKLVYSLKGYSYVDEPKNLADIKRIVFVCKGNICRSAVAHHYLKNISNYNLHSFGLNTDENKPANQRMVDFSFKKGINLALHKTSSIASYDHCSSDLLVCMEPWQCKQIKQLFPNAKTTLLGIFLDKNRPYLHDPYSACIPYVEFCIDLIKDASEKINEYRFPSNSKNIRHH